MSVNFTPSTEINAALWSNPAEAASKYKSDAFKADLKAKVALVALGVITVAAVTLAAVYMPALVPVVLIVAGAAVKSVYNKFYLHYRDESKKFTEFAEHMAGVAQKIDSYQQQHFNGSDFYSKLHELGINANGISNQDCLREMDAEQDAFRPLKNLIGRVEYWSETADRYKKEIQELDEKIQKKAKQMMTPGLDLEQHRKEKSAWLLFNIQKHKLEEENYIPAKLAAAYNLHVIDNVKDTREYSSFGHPEPSSYLHSVTFEHKDLQPYYLFAPERNQPPLSKQWMMEHSPQEIAREIFKGSSIYTV